MIEPIIPPAPRESILRHKRERNLQIVLPITIALVLVILAGALLVIATSNNCEIARWAAIALTCLTIPIMVMSLVMLIALSVLIWGAAKVYSQAPEYSGQAIDFLKTTSVQVKHYSDRAAEPFIALKTWLGVPDKMTGNENKK
jgi:hypothetical protein